MFPCEDIWRGVLSAVIGGLIAVLLLKLLENNPQNQEIAAQREVPRGPGDFDETPKEPQENDERFCQTSECALMTYI